MTIVRIKEHKRQFNKHSNIVPHMKRLPNNTLVPHMIRLPSNTYKRMESAHRKNI